MNLEDSIRVDNHHIVLFSLFFAVYPTEVIMRFPSMYWCPGKNVFIKSAINSSDVEFFSQYHCLTSILRPRFATTL